jgi:hypothetical protein
MENVAFVVPLMSVKIAPPSVLTCHCIAGAWSAVAVKVAPSPIWRL